MPGFGQRDSVTGGTVSVLGAHKQARSQQAQSRPESFWLTYFTGSSPDVKENGSVRWLGTVFVNSEMWLRTGLEERLPCQVLRQAPGPWEVKY